MRRTLPADHPNLVLAQGRLRRIEVVWAGLFVAMGLLALTGGGSVRPLSSLPWLATAGLLIAFLQPALLALVAIQWIFSLLPFIPNVNTAVPPDPLVELLQPGALELFALGAVRVLLMITAWNQFLFYRMLYGTARSAGLDPDLPVIPEVISNRTDRLAVVGRIVGVLGLVVAWSPLAFAPELSRHLFDLALFLATVAIGLGFGAAFSPTDRRGIALGSVGLGFIGFLSAVAAARVTLV